MSHHRQVPLRKRVRDIFLFGFLAGALIVVCAHIASEVILKKNARRTQSERVRTLADGLMPLLRDEVLANRVYAVSARGHDFWTSHAGEGLQIGIYQPNGTAMFETGESVKLRKILAGYQLNDLVWERRDIVFANEVVGKVVLAVSNAPEDQVAFRRNFSILILTLLASFIAVFLIIQYSLSRWVVTPANELVASISNLGRYLEADTAVGNFPTNFGILELNEIGIALNHALERYRESTHARREIELTAQRQKVFFEIASQVAHDIRSPLAALRVAQRNLPAAPGGSQTLLQEAIRHINEIADQMLEQTRTSLKEAPKATHLLTLIDSILAEKRTQYLDRPGLVLTDELGPGAYSLFARVQPLDFMRAVSNLIDNAIEAIDPTTISGKVIVSISSSPELCEVSVNDNGKGIPAEILPSLGQRGASYGKSSGTGLGLYSVRQAVEEWGGKLSIDSQIGLGTQIRLLLPRSAAPGWFVDAIHIGPSRAVIVLDDDISVHEAWRSRLDQAGMLAQGLSFACFTDPQELKRWIQEHEQQASQALYLIDYEIPQASQSGLELLQELQLTKKGYLVTSRFEEAYLQSSCQASDIKMIPKTLVALIPIH